MLDIKYVREHLDEVAETMKNRHASFDPEQFTALDVQRREVIAEEEALQAERNKLSKEIGALMGQGKTDEANAAKETVRQINERLTALGDARAEAEAAMDALMLSIPNMVDATTPVGEDENDNPEVRRWGTPRDFAAEGFEPQAHWDLGPALNIVDFERGVKLAESRFYVLGGAGARLERALIAFMLDQHTSRGYKEWWVPALANAATLTGTGQLPKFEEGDVRGGFYDYFQEPKFSRVQELLKVMDEIAGAHDKPVAQVAVNWSTQKEYVGTALVGVRTDAHAIQNCETFEWELSADEMAKLDAKLDELKIG